MNEQTAKRKPIFGPVSLAELVTHDFDKFEAQRVLECTRPSATLYMVLKKFLSSQNGVIDSNSLDYRICTTDVCSMNKSLVDKQSSLRIVVAKKAMSSWDYQYRLGTLKDS